MASNYQRLYLGEMVKKKAKESRANQEKKNENEAAPIWYAINTDIPLIGRQGDVFI